MSARAYILRETGISMLINAAISLGFFLIVFRGLNPVPLWGMGSLIFDFLPQSFMIALMSVLVPGAIAMRQRAKGALPLLDYRSRLPRRLARRALLLAVAAMLLGTTLMAMLGRLSGLSDLGWNAALAIKVVYGALLAGLVTPIGLRVAMAADGGVSVVAVSN